MDGTAPLKGTNETNLPTEQPKTQTDARFSRAHEQRRRPPGAQTPARQGAQAADRQHPTEATPPSAAPRGQGLPRSIRIRKRREFLALERTGRRRAGTRFIVLMHPQGRGASRLGITASRRVGGAVVRNRVKRLVREFFRRHRHAIVPPQDVVVIARPTAAKATYEDVTRELSRALHIDVGA